jgi:hypothetical protein
MRALSLAIATLSFSLVSAVGCGGPKEYEPYSTSQRTIFMPSVRTVGAEPVYARTRWVRPPEVLPQRDRPGAVDEQLRETPSLRTVFQLSLQDVTLEETARILAATARYSSYTAPSIASEKISIKNLGTIDELARIIESKAQVQVVVDHENKEVRFLPASGQSPRLFEE